MRRRERDFIAVVVGWRRVKISGCRKASLYSPLDTDRATASYFILFSHASVGVRTLLDFGQSIESFKSQSSVCAISTDRVAIEYTTVVMASTFKPRRRRRSREQEPIEP